MKNFTLLILFSLMLFGTVYSQQALSGKVLSQRDSLPIAGAVVSVQGSKTAVSTNALGSFTVPVSGDDVVLTIQHIGYEPQNLAIKILQNKDVTVYLEMTYQIMQEVEVVSTGYQQLPRERATGSFATVDKELFNQQVGTDILSRLPAITNSMVMDNGRLLSGQMIVRGLSTISGPKDPLIVVDNFPYDGDITNINPNIVESITVLKDASASSIWGARAANGVIVITTKSGQFNQPTTLEFNSNLMLGAKPDLGYIRQMSSNDFINVEQELFSRNFYNSQINAANRPVISPVVDLLNKVRNGELSEEQGQQQISALREIDVRDQFNQYMYKPSVNQQYFLSAHGGTGKFLWTSSAGYDHNKDNLGSSYQRINLRFRNTYRPIDNLSFTTGLYYTQSQNASGRTGYSGVSMRGSFFVPYTQMADAQGNPLAVPRTWNQSFIETAGDGKLLDWNYYPLTDWKHQISDRKVSDILITSELNYQLINGLNAIVSYQYERQVGLNNSLADENSYMARNYINSFAQIINDNVDFIVPVGGILDKSNSVLTANNLRGQLSFDNTYEKHNISAITGAEIRSANIDSHQVRYYGYNPNNLTTGNVDYRRAYPSFIGGGANFIQDSQHLGQTDTRFVSYFANAAYTFDNRYILSASGRRDASNLFGLKTNDQWNPFWSAGLAWKVSNEQFYNSGFFPYLNLRATYGFSGNIDPSMVAVNTIIYQSAVSIYNGLQVAQFNNYYNPLLKWETSKMFNLGVDFRLKNDRLSGSVEYYHKKGENLFGTSPVDYTTGVPPSMLRNVASMKGAGWDIELKSLNIDKLFKWRTILNFSIYRDKIIDYEVNRTLARQYVIASSVPISGIKDHPVYAIYAYKWAGLDPDTGEAQGYLDGEISKDYNNITGTGTKVEDLEYFGSAIPTRYGSLINVVSYKDLSLQVGVSFKFGYWFRRSSINYTDLFNNWNGHSDYAYRWQNPGDEAHTDVPVNPYTTNSNRDAFFNGSSVLVEKADHIRLQYVNLAYDLKFPNSIYNKTNAIQLYFNINNIGLLWKATDLDIDPDFNIGANNLVSPTNYALGIRARF